VWRQVRLSGSIHAWLSNRLPGEFPRHSRLGVLSTVPESEKAAGTFRRLFFLMTTPFTFVLSFAAQLVRPFRSRPPRKPTSVPSLLADARSQLSLRCSTHNAQNSAAGEGRVSQREEGCTLPVTDGFGEARPLHIDPATKRPIASRAAAITSINVT